MSDPNELQRIVDDVRRHLAWQRESGEEQVLAPRPSAPARTPAPPAASSAAPAWRQAAERQVAAPVPSNRARPTAVQVPSEQTQRELAALGERPMLDEIRRVVGDCRRCKLCSGRQQIVFGAGSPRAELVFVGEGPGADEDAQGIPFVGKAGQLLTKMIEAMGFTRDEVYICNIVKCRPPGNRNPEPDEIAACEPFLQAQLRAIRPRVIVALGKFSAQTLLRDPTPITRMRGLWREYERIPVMPTFHPAYLLRNPPDKKLVWADLQQVMKIFGKSPRKGEG